MLRNRIRTIAATAAILVTAAGLSGCSDIETLLDHEISGPTSQTTAGPEDVPTQDQTQTRPAGGDYLEITGPAERPYEVTEPGEVEYCELDELERPVCAFGELTSQTRQDAARRDRQDISIDPPGWPEDNAEVTIPALPDVEGSQEYHGWLWNRSHLLADSLGGAPSAENLVTGTRTQNVGSTFTDGEYSGGMGYTERLARDYLDTGRGDACPLYYSTTANYAGQNLIPSTVTVNIQTCDESINERVVVFNTAEGFDINYADGSWQEAR